MRSDEMFTYMWYKSDSKWIHSAAVVSESVLCLPPVAIPLTVRQATIPSLPPMKPPTMCLKPFHRYMKPSLLSMKHLQALLRNHPTLT